MGRETLASLLVLSALVPCGTGGQRELVDEEYRFRLVAPGAEWQLLGEDEARKMAPDAVAMLLQPRGVFAAVIVEHAPDADVAAMAAVMRDAVGCEEPVDEGTWEIEYRGRAAVRYQLSGRVDELTLRYQNTVFRNGEFLYQLLCWGLTDVVGELAHEFEPVHGAFTLLEGEPRLRRSAHPLIDSHGVGWRLRGGVFECAPYALRVQPAEGWRVAVGQELYSMNASAEVGLVSEGPDVYVVLVPERVVGIPASVLAENARQEFAAGMEARGEPFPVRIGDVECSMQLYRGDEATSLHFVYGAFARGEICHQVIVWFLGERTEAVSNRLSEAWAALGFLDEPARLALKEELVALADPEGEVGEDFSLRAGTYRDWGASLTWQAPPGWRVRAGQRARSSWGEGARFVVEEPELGLQAVLLVEESWGTLAEEHEEAVLELLEDAEVSGQEIALGDVAALESALSLPGEPARWGYRIVTTQAGGLSYELLFLGLEGNLAAAGAAIAAARDGLRVGVELEEPDVRDGVYRDEKLGFTLASPEGSWRADTDLVPGDAAKVAGCCGWTDASGREVFAIAIGILWTGMDASTLENMIVGEIGRRVGGREEQRAATLEGLPARCRSFGSGTRKVEVLVARRGNQLVLLGISSRKGSPTLEDAERCFAFLP